MQIRILKRRLPALQYHSEKFRFTNLIAYYYQKLLKSHGSVLEGLMLGKLSYLTLLMEKENYLGLFVSDLELQEMPT